MILSIKNASPVMKADLIVLGAAVKILLAGGSDISGAEMKRASGSSYYLWKTKGEEITALVRDLEAAQAPSGQ